MNTDHQLLELLQIADKIARLDHNLAVILHQRHRRRGDIVITEDTADLRIADAKAVHPHRIEADTGDESIHPQAVNIPGARYPLQFGFEPIRDLSQLLVRALRIF